MRQQAETTTKIKHSYYYCLPSRRQVDLSTRHPLSTLTFSVYASTMKFSAIVVALLVPSANAFAPVSFGTTAQDVTSQDNSFKVSSPISLLELLGIGVEFV